MSAVREPEVSFERVPANAPAPPPAPPSTRQRVGPSVGLLVVATVFALLGHSGAAAIAVLASLVVGVASFVSDDFVRWFAKVQHRFAHFVGVALTTVLLLPVHYLIITPMGFVTRLLRLDLLGPPSGTDGWQQRSDDHVDRPRKGYADERSAVGVVTRKGRRAHTVRVVVAVLVVQALVFATVRIVSERRTPAPEFVGVSGGGPRESAALQGLPWLDEAMTELSTVAQTKVYTPIVGSSARDIAGRYVNVTSRERRSYTTTAPGEPIVVWFLGGSTMFGFDAQRDDHTIPSEVVRLAEAQGVPIEAHNFGGSGYTNFQETQILAQRLAAGGRPDVVVFYDGINDSALQLHNALAHRDVPGEPGQLQSDVIRNALVTSGVIPGGDTHAPAPLLPENAPVPAGQVTLEGLITDIVGAYGQGVDLARNLGEAYGFTVYHYWQPDLFSRSPLDPGEEPLVAAQGMDAFVFASMRALFERVRAQLPEGVVDISNAYDEVDGPVLSDIVHVNEVGAEAIAAAMYPSLQADLASRSTP